MRTFAATKIEKIIRDAGAQRVSNSAIVELDKLVGARGTEIAKQAVELAAREGRKTIRESDITQAL
ncbi:MAG: histone [Candidatus Heimdallarchaeota archaeon]